MRRAHPDEFDFHAKSYVLPQDRDLLDRDFEELGKEAVFIKKPPNAAQGHGISLVTRSEEVPTGKRLLVQRYIGEPYLIGNKKFDMRIYVAVTSWDPLRVYVYDEGLARFATKDYVPIKSSGNPKPNPQPNTNPDPKPNPNSDSKPDPDPDPNPYPYSCPKLKPNPNPKSELDPTLSLNRILPLTLSLTLTLILLSNP